MNKEQQTSVIHRKESIKYKKTIYKNRVQDLAFVITRRIISFIS